MSMKLLNNKSTVKVFGLLNSLSCRLRLKSVHTCLTPNPICGTRVVGIWGLLGTPAEQVQGHLTSQAPCACPADTFHCTLSSKGLLKCFRLARQSAIAIMQEFPARDFTITHTRQSGWRKMKLPLKGKLTDKQLLITKYCIPSNGSKITHTF